MKFILDALGGTLHPSFTKMGTLYFFSNVGLISHTNLTVPHVSFSKPSTPDDFYTEKKIPVSLTS
jgi:hypothetical protein